MVSCKFSLELIHSQNQPPYITRGKLRAATSTEAYFSASILVMAMAKELADPTTTLGPQIQSPISSSWEASRFRRIAWNATGFSNHPNLQCSSGRSAASLHWPGWRPEVQNTLGMPKGLLYIVYSAWTHLYMWYIYIYVCKICVCGCKTILNYIDRDYRASLQHPNNLLYLQQLLVQAWSLRNQEHQDSPLEVAVGGGKNDQKSITNGIT